MQPYTVQAVGGRSNKPPVEQSQRITPSGHAMSEGTDLVFSAVAYVQDPNVSPAVC